MKLYSLQPIQDSGDKDHLLIHVKMCVIHVIGTSDTFIVYCNGRC